MFVTSALVNGATGVVEDIVWNEGCTRSSDLPSLAVLVSCATYSGPTLWRTEPRTGFPEGIPIVPITAVKATFEGNGRTLGRTQLPLRLAWAVTVHKSQGLTMARVRIGLGASEPRSLGVLLGIDIRRFVPRVVSGLPDTHRQGPLFARSEAGREGFAATERRPGT